MSQKQQYTEFWKLLSLTEDFLKYGKKTGEYELPEWNTETMTPTAGKPSPEESMPAVKPNTGHPLVSLKLDRACRNCGIAKMGRQPVAAIGTDSPRLLVLCGPPSVRAEQNHVPLAAEEMDYFLKWIQAIELDLEKDVLLMNFPRCRPPGNRHPFPEEMNLCAKMVRQVVEQVKPVLILTLGPTPSGYFSGHPGSKVSEIREQAGIWEGVPLLATYSPDQVLTYGELKRPVWEDLKRVRNLLHSV